MIGKIDFTHEGMLSAKQSATSSYNDLNSTIKVETIDQICENFELTHIKMDREGAEMSAIHGELNTLKNTRPKSSCLCGTNCMTLLSTT